LSYRGSLTISYHDFTKPAKTEVLRTHSGVSVPGAPSIRCPSVRLPVSRRMAHPSVGHVGPSPCIVDGHGARVHTDREFSDDRTAGCIHQGQRVGVGVDNEERGTVPTKLCLWDRL